MPQSASDRSQHEQQLDALIAEYYEAAEQGRPLEHEDFLRQHPEFATELRDFFADAGELKQVVPPVPEPEETQPVSGSGTSSLSPGTKVRYFGDYEMLEELGAGGMGIVYKARQAKLKRIVALKMIKVGHLASDSEVRRFQAEAQAAAKLDHPGIVAVHEVGVHRNQQYYTMDFVGGGSLSKLHRDEPVASRRAAELVKQLAEAMHYAHGQGIVHRDLKPANILLTTIGAPRITDFGLAKRLWSDGESAGASMTETGQVLGTAGYMSPEQAAGKTRLVGPPADIYALGAVLYALLTSRAPFVGESQADTILQVIHNDPILPRVLNPSVPRDLETICLKCLEKEPHKRYGTAELLADDLGRYLAGRPVVARPISRPARCWRWCRRNPWAATALALGILVASVSPIVAWRQTWLAGQVEQALNAEQRAAKAARESARQERRRRYVSDMNLVAFHWDAGNVEAMRALLRQHEPRGAEEDLREFVWRYWSYKLLSKDRVKRVPAPVLFAHSVAVSPDGKRIAFANSSRLVRVSPASAIHVQKYDTPADEPDEFRLQLKEPNSTIIDLAFVLDGNTLAVHQRQSVTLWNLAGAVATSETLPLEITQENGIGDGSFSENGRFLALPRVSHSFEQPNIGATNCEIWDLVERKRVGQTAITLGPRCVAISDDGASLADSRGLIRQLKDEQDLELPGKPDLLRVWLLPDGQGLVSRNSQGRLSVWDRQGQERILADSCGLVAVSTQRQEVCWSTPEGVVVQSLAAEGRKRRLPERIVVALVYAPNGKDLLTVSDKTVTWWPLNSDDGFDPLSPTKVPGTPMAASPLGTYVATGRQMWETATGKLLGEYSNEKGTPQVAVTEAGEVVTCNRGDTITIWNGKTGQDIDSFRQPLAADADTFLNVAAGLDGNLIAATRPDGKIFLWNRKQETMHLLDAKVQVLLPQLKELALAPAPEFSPDGKLLQVRVHWTGPAVTVWNLETLQVAGDHPGWGNWFRFRDQWVFPRRSSEDDTQLVSVSTGQNVCRLGIPPDFIAIAATADGINLATQAGNGKLTIWDLRLSAPLLSMEAQPGKMCFLQEEGVLALIQSNGAIRHWRAPVTAPR